MKGDNSSNKWDNPPFGGFFNDKYMEIKREHEGESGETLGVFEETAPLRKVLMWGAPGAETVLGQLLPKKINCFEAEFDVPAARQEFEGAKSMLEREGIEVVLVKDLFAKMVSEKGMKPSKNMDQLKDEIRKRAFAYDEKYKGQEISDLEEVLSWLDGIIEDDIVVYGEEATVVMNDILSLGSELPLSNVLYARDQSNLLGRTWVWSSMRHTIRQPEVKLYRRVLEHAGIIKDQGLEIVSVDGGGKFEGGDGIAYDGKVYVGVGGRTNMIGVRQIAPYILGQGVRLLIPIDRQRAAGELDEMDAMHLDTFWMPCGPKQVVACEEEVSRRELIEIAWSNGSLKAKNRGWLADHMAESGMDIVPLSKDEQKHYAPNFLNLGNNQIVLSLSEGNNLTNELARRGKEVFSADLENITKGFGGLHCITAAIKRG